jgi:cytochrome c-type biogenesis protein CcmF
MLTLGSALLFLALAAAVFQIVVTGLAFRRAGRRREQALAAAHNAVRAIWVLLSLAFGLLFYQFLTNDFTNQYVFAHSARSQPALYKISAAWGGQEGSLLMWAWVLSLYGVAVAASGRRLRQEIAPTTAAVISGVNVFFISMIALAANPFRAAAVVQPDGMGLNPLLQNYWMQIHPPTLYTGYVGCTSPFAFAVAGLLHRRFDEKWVLIVRRWALFAWIVLTIGIIMGGVWAYETLGWGGYWAWDPVENASFLPWLTLTAFVHSAMLQGRRGLLKNWNMILVSLTFLLSIFGTFLTRSGVVQSVHAFAQSNIGIFFVGFLVFAFVSCLIFLRFRRDE